MYNNVLEFKAISLASLTLFNSRVRTSMIFLFFTIIDTMAPVSTVICMYNDVLIAFICCHRESSSPFSSHVPTTMLYSTLCK